MNKDRRKQLTEIRGRLNEIWDELETIQGEEQDYFDNMPESIQSGERGDAAQEAAEALESAHGCVHDAMSYIEEAESS